MELIRKSFAVDHPEPVTSATTLEAPKPILGQFGVYWTPDSTDVTTHAGFPLPDDLAYIAPPPTEEIGDIVSVYSTIRIGKGGEKNYALRVGWCIVLACLVGLVAFWGQFAISPLIYVSVAGVASTLLWLTVAPQNSTTYIGTQGIARFLWNERENRIKAIQILRFQDDIAMFVTAGARRRGDRSVTFFAPNGGISDGSLFTLYATPNRATMSSTERENSAFARAAESAYVQYRLPTCQKALRHGETITFPIALGKTGTIAVSSTALTISIKQKIDTIPYQELVEISLVGDVLTIARTGYSRGLLGVGERGIYTFFARDISNLPILLALLESITQPARCSLPVLKNQ